METDELEFLISQHFDGTLDAADAARLQRHLASDHAARTLYNEHAKLDAALRASGASLAIDESWLSAQIADRIDEANATPIRIRNWGWAMPAAMAACLAIGLSVGSLFRGGQSSEQITQATPTTQPTIASTPIASTPIAEVAIAVPAAEPQRRTGYATVSVGAPANMTPQIVAALYLAQDFNASRVSIRAAGHRQADVFD